MKMPLSTAFNVPLKGKWWPSVSASALSTPDLQPLSLHATASDADSDPVALQWAMKDAGGKGYSLVQGTDGTPVFTKPLGEASITDIMATLFRGA